MLSKMRPIRRGLLFGGPGQEFLGVCTGHQPQSQTNCNPNRGFREAQWLTEPSRMLPGNLYGLVAGFVGDCCNMGKPAWPLLNMSGAATFDNVSAALPAGSLANRLGGARQLSDPPL